MADLVITKDVNPKEEGAIPNNLWANVMRVSMENKNLLEGKGSLYVGTGDYNEVIDGEGNKQTICRTEAFSGPAESGQVLASNGKGSFQWQDPPAESGQVLASNGKGSFQWQTLIRVFEIKQEQIDEVWQNSSNSLIGAYECKISPDTHNLGTTNNIFVQVMTPDDTSGYTIVNTTINIAEGVITIYSNIKTKAKILLLSVGG